MNRRHAFGLLTVAALLPAWPAHAAEDAMPEATLSAVLGEWRGTFTTREDGKSGAAVTMPTKAYVSMLAPDELAVHFVFGDASGKASYGYERLRFEFASDTLIWVSGARERTALVGRIVATANEAGVRRYVVDSSVNRTLMRYTFEFGPASFAIKADEIEAGGQAVNRNLYMLQRPL